VTSSAKLLSYGFFVSDNHNVTFKNPGNMHKISKTFSLATLALMFATNLSQPALAQNADGQFPAPVRADRSRAKTTRLSAYHKKWIHRSRHVWNSNAEPVLGNSAERLARRAARAKKNLSSDSWRAAIAEEIAETLRQYGVDSTADAVWTKSYITKRASIENKDKRSWQSRGQAGAYKVNRTDGTILVDEVAVPSVKFQSDHLEKNFLKHVRDSLHSNKCLIMVAQVDAVLSAKSKVRAERIVRYLEQSIATAKRHNSYYKPMTSQEISGLELYMNGLKKDDYDLASEYRQKLKRLTQQIKRRLESDRNAGL
jgi:hypothetical protein